ncbi:MAG: GGDEF domain-containing protein [Synechococcaceae cyanobacterium RL_1_2]|nr:GGDEF domain-containing protein [Synechococcaceae cyanobacterium RL_1_2]
MRLLDQVSRLSVTFKIILVILLIAIIGFCDYATGNEISFSIFYVMPIALVSWEVSFALGLTTALICGVVWLFIELALNADYSNALIPYWNGLVRLTFFCLVSTLMSKLKQSLAHEQQLARIDYLTGATNSRFFYELFQIEFYRCQRYQTPLTLVFMDLDNFKLVNDQFGHGAGDQALQIVVNYLKRNLRKIDIVARLGGDEFALVMPDTDQASVQSSLSRIRTGLLAEMKIHQWPISFSMGVLTYRNAPASIEELMRTADKLMYEVKNSGKNAIKYANYPLE